MTTYLLDANLLIALTIEEHEHHERATHWVTGVDRFALCPVVEGALVRFLVRLGEQATAGTAVIEAVRTLSRCEFWPDSLSYGEVALDHVRGHRQVTDAYLASLAEHHGGALATFDEALAAELSSVALVP